MRRWRWLVSGCVPPVIVLACTSFNSGGEPPAGPAFDASVVVTPTMEAATSETGAPVIEAGDASDGSTRCNSTMPFIRYEPLGTPVNTTQYDEYLPRLTPDELVLYVTRSDGNYQNVRRYERSTAAAPWVAATGFDPMPGDGVNRMGAWAGSDAGFVYSSRYSGSEFPYWRVVRVLPDGGSLEAVSATELGAADNYSPSLTADESELYFASSRTGSHDIYRSVRDAGTLGYGPPTALGIGVNTTADELYANISYDGLSIYFASASGRVSGFAIWMAMRSSFADPFTNRKLLADLNDLQDEKAPKKPSAIPGWLSPDECRLYLSSTLDDGRGDIFVAYRR